MRQQRKQLDDNKRLLEKLEREQQGFEGTDIPPSPHILAYTSESGTIPSFTSASFSASPRLTTSSVPPHSRPPLTSPLNKHTSTSHTHFQRTRSHTGSKTGAQAGTQTGTQTASMADHGVQTGRTHSPRTTPTYSPRGVAKVGVVATSGSASDDYGRRGATSSTAVQADGRKKAELGSLYEQCKLPFSSVV